MEKTYHLIDDYLSGKLVGRKLDSFKAELKASEKLQEQVAIQQAIIETLEESRKAELKEYLAANVSKGGISYIPNLASALGAAAMISMLVAAYFIIDFVVDKRTDNIVKENTSKYPKKDTSIEDTKLFIDSLANDTQTLAISELPDVTNEIEPPSPPELKIVEEMEMDDVDLDFDEMVEEEVPVFKPEGKAAPASTDNVEVKRDIKLSSKTYVIRSLVPPQKEEAEVETVAKSKPKKNMESDDSVSETIVTTTEKAPLPNRSVNVEYWQSVVNYKGYNFDGKILKLYGIAAAKKLEFKELDGRIYLKLDGNNFYIEKNGNYNRLVALTNPTLLNILND